VPGEGVLGVVASRPFIVTSPSASAPDPSSNSRLAPFALWLAVRKNWLLVCIITIAVTAGMAFYTLGQTRIYEVSATILFDPSVPRPLGGRVQSDDAGNYWNNKEYYRTQQWMIQSMRVASQVVRDLELNKDGNFLANLPKSAGPRPAPKGVTVESAAQVLMSRLSIEPIKDSRLTIVKYQDADAARAPRILSALVDIYAQDNLDDVFESATMAADWLRNQVGTLRQDLESSEMALHEYKKSRNILSLSLDDQSNMLRGQMSQLNQALTQVRTQREKTAARLAELLKIANDDPSSLPVLELLESPMLSSLRGSYVDATKEVNALRSSGFGENHPEVRRLQSRADTAREALLNEVRNVQGAFQRDLAARDREIAGLSGLYAKAEQEALDLNLLEIEYNRLRRAKENNEKLFGIVIERSKESDLTRMLRVNNIRVVDRPLTPKRPVSPNIPLNLAGGLAFGLALGLGVAIAREQLDRSLRNPEDVERELGLPFLGLLPQVGFGAAEKAGYRSRRRRKARQPEEALPAPELFVHHRPASGTAEAARAIRTNILFTSPDRPYNTLLVTSAGPSEGKTTVACSIAITMAQAGQRVVLVDCDLRRPRVHRVFGRTNDLGLTTALLDGSAEAGMATETEVPNLSVIPTGPIPPNPAELLQSAAFAALLERLRGRYDRVVLDSPPLVPVTDAAILSTLVDGTILVVRASRTTRELARRALRALRDVKGRTVGVVLNAVDLEGRNYGYYQYYQYKRDGYGPLPPLAGAEDTDAESGQDARS
jgi:polysaccharide biosynthesis transport protein